MEVSGCSGCRERDARIADLERRLAEVEARLKTNATNSSTPPSANPLDAAKPTKKKKSKRRRGGHPNHPPHLKQLLPPEQVTRTELLVPEECSSKRNVEELAGDVFGAPIALGTVANLEQEVSAALEPAHQEAVQAVRQAEVKFADETSWKLWGKLCWLWAAASASVVAFVIHARRSALGLAALLGEEIGGILHTDRWNVYLQVPEKCRQLCWAHLKRDFQKIVDCGGSSAFVGRRGLRIVKELFAAWHRFQEGKVTRRQLSILIEPLRRRLAKALLDGGLGDDARVAKFCENLLNVESALWTFVTHEGVEPTNNYIERLLRRAVLWRRRSFGCNSVTGCQFVERILTVVQTCRLRGTNVLEYIHKAVNARRQGAVAPSLLSQ
jgi:transposase